jgi:hypothetical protein
MEAAAVEAPEPELSLEDFLLHAALTRRTTRIASFGYREVWSTEVFIGSPEVKLKIS